MIAGDYLIPLVKPAIENSIAQGSIADMAVFYGSEDLLEDLSAGTVALIFAESGNANNANCIVNALGLLHSHWSNIKVAVLGRLITSDNSEYNDESLFELLSILSRKGVIPVVVSGSGCFVNVFCDAHAKSDKNDLAIVAPSSDIFGMYANPLSVHLKSELLQSLKGLSVIGSQGYFTGKQPYKVLQGCYYQNIRLGQLRESMSYAEPALRDASTLIFDLSSLRYSDFTSASFTSPNGLYAEEMCRLMRYAGISDGIKSIFFGGFNWNKLSDSNSDLLLIAEGIWHFLDGLSNRRNEIPGISSFPSREFYVDFGDQDPITLNFLQSDVTGRWWLNVTGKEGQRKWIACDAEDYEKAKHHELPLRWVTYAQVGK